MQIIINKNKREPLYKQIYNQIVNMIISGSLPEGYKLPPERKLAQTLGVNRTTVLNAYRDLKADGYISSHIGSGTIVLALKKNNNANINHLPIIYSHLFSKVSDIKGDKRFVEKILSLANRKDIISFAAGIPNPEINPIEDIKVIQEQIIDKYKNMIFHHTPSTGIGKMKKAIKGLMEEKNVFCSEEEIMVTSGAQQGISLCAQLFINPGDTIIVEEPTFFMAKQIFQMYGANLIGIPVDEDGMNMDYLSIVLENTNPKFVYTIPDFQNPTGTVLSSKRKSQLLKLAYKHQFLIIEDAAYSELCYGTKRPVSLKSMDEKKHVIHLGTFSKVLFMGLRIGWICAPKQIIEKISEIKQLHDLHSNSQAQWLLSCIVHEGVYKKHLKKVIDENKKRLDTMISALSKYKPEGIDIHWTVPEGGLYIWLELPDSIDTNKLLDRTVEKGVAFVPGTLFMDNNEKENIRLNFSYTSIEQINKGIKILMNTIKELYKDIDNSQNNKAVFPII